MKHRTVLAASLALVFSAATALVLVAVRCAPDPPPDPNAVTLDQFEAKAVALGLEVRRAGPPGEQHRRLSVIDRSLNPEGVFYGGQAGALTVVEMDSASEAARRATANPMPCWAAGRLWMKGDRDLAERILNAE